MIRTMAPAIGWLIVIVVLLIALFPLVVNSFARSTLKYLESELGPRNEGFSGGPWYNYTNTGNGSQVFNSLALDFGRNLVFLTRGSHTRVEKIHSIAGGSMDDRFSPYHFPTKSWYVLSFGPNLDSLRLYQPSCGILEVQINNEKPIQMYSKLSAAAKFPSTDVMYIGGLLYAPNNTTEGMKSAPNVRGTWFHVTGIQGICVRAPCHPELRTTMFTITGNKITIVEDLADDKSYDIQSETTDGYVTTLKTPSGAFTVRGEPLARVIEVTFPSGKMKKFYNSNKDANKNRTVINFGGEEPFEIGSLKNGVDAVLFPEKLNTTEMPFSASYIACRPPILPLIPRPASAASVSSRELSTLS